MKVHVLPPSNMPVLDMHMVRQKNIFASMISLLFVGVKTKQPCLLQSFVIPTMWPPEEVVILIL